MYISAYDTYMYSLVKYMINKYYWIDKGDQPTVNGQIYLIHTRNVWYWVQTYLLTFGLWKPRLFRFESLYQPTKNTYHPWDWYVYLHLVNFYGKCRQKIPYITWYGKHCPFRNIFLSKITWDAPTPCTTLLERASKATQNSHQPRVFHPWGQLLVFSVVFSVKTLRGIFLVGGFNQHIYEKYYMVKMG